MQHESSGREFKDHSVSHPNVLRCRNNGFIAIASQEWPHALSLHGYGYAMARFQQFTYLRHSKRGRKFLSAERQVMRGYDRRLSVFRHDKKYCVV